MGKSVAIILVNYNGYNDTVNCVKSIIAGEYKDYKIILVDNGSDDREIILNDAFLNDKCDVILHPDNIGFSGGNNVGIEYAKKIYNPDFFLLLNNDTEIDNMAIVEMVQAIEQIPNCGIMTGKILYYDKPEIIWSAGGKFDFKTGIADQPAMGKTDDGSYDSICETTFCTGCVMLIPAEVIDTVGLLSEEYFLYAEDTDYCCRVMNAGYKLGYTGHARIYHKVSSSTGRGSNLSQYYNVRNNLYIIEKYCTNKIYGYLKRRYRTIKSMLKKELSLKMIRKGYHDYRKQVKGKVEL